MYSLENENVLAKQHMKKIFYTNSNNNQISKSG